MYIVRYGNLVLSRVGIHLARDVSLRVVLSWTARLYDAYFGSEALLKWGGVYWPLVAQPGHLPDVSPARRALGLRKSLEGRGLEANAEQMHRHGAVKLGHISAISRASHQGPSRSTSVSRGASLHIVSALRPK